MNPAPMIINLPFDINNSTTLDQEESIKYHQNALMAPTIVGGWQKEKGYIPCRIFKTISYGHIGITNSKEAYEVVNRLAIYNSDEEKLPLLGIAQMDNITLRLNAMKIVRDKHTYVQRINTIQMVFMTYIVSK